MPPQTPQPSPKPHIKNHDGWNTLKKQIDSRPAPNTVYFHVREVWFCCIGHNIGYENDGKGIDFGRPVVIIKRYGPNLFMGIPLTTQIKSFKHYFGVGNVNGKPAMAMVTQMRLFSSKRLVNKMDVIPSTIFNELKKAARRLIL